MIRILLVDDQRIVRAGLRMLCEASDDLLVVGEASTGQQAVTLAGREKPDVILMDLRMPGLDGIRATRRIVAATPSAKVVALTTFDDDEHLYPALEAGAAGFLAKDVAPGELLAAVRRAAAGDSPFSPAVLRRLVTRALGNRPESPPDLDVTDREREVLALVGAGLSNADIAERLFVGVTTVKTHVASLMTKTGSANRVQLAVLATRMNIR